VKNKIIKLRNEGKTYNEISEILNCSKGTISYHCSKLKENNEHKERNIKVRNLLQKKDDFFTPKEEIIKKIIDLRELKKTYDEISNELKISKYIVSKICRELKLVNNRKFGRIDDEVISMIRKMYDEIGSSLKVSKLLNISKSTVLKYIEVKNKEKLNEYDRKKNNSKSVIDWRRRTKIKLLEYKGGKCERCGYNKCTDALEFHHLDPNEKDFTISGKSWSFERLKKEAEKCILVCSNCHKEIHYNLKFTPMA
jgi:DNA invertase Pin-like site-specific DNA recombinase